MIVGRYDQYRNFKNLNYMKNTTFALGLILIAISAKAQWNNSGSNLTTSDNVGIGVSIPQTKLHLEGNVNGWLQQIKGTVTQPNELIGIKFQTGYPGEYGKWAGISAIGESEHSNTTGLGLFAGQLEHLRISSNGNVGIGTTDPKNKLSVNGTIWATEVKVSLTDGADWVFEDDYKLKPLNEVEEFINTNKHLPEIPSADDMRKNDLSLGEMNNKLLQKIEELTLYLIEQNKQNQAQQAEIEALKAKIANL